MSIMRKMKSVGSSLVLLTCVIAASVQAAEYYKWIGEDGVIHYGATPPKGVEAELVKTYGGVATSSSQDAAPPAGATTTTNNSTASPPPAKLTPEQVAAKNERCAQERERLTALSKPGRIRMTQADGSVKYLSEEEIAREVEVTKKVIADSCE